MNKVIHCPSCGVTIQISSEYKVELYDYPVRTIIEFLNEKIPEEENKIALKRIIENKYSFKAEVTTKLTNKELKRLINVVVMDYCDSPRLYQGHMIAGGIGPTTLSYTNGVITAYDPVPDVTVELSVVRETKH
jgi:hypothetical protein